MAKQGKENNFRNANDRMKYTGTDEWVNVRTGEKRIVDNFEKPMGRTPGSFMIAYLAEIISLIDKLGNQKMQVVKYILQNMNKSDNTLIITNRELAKKAGVGINTVTETLKLLREANLIVTRSGSLMLSPALMNNKKPEGEASMMVKYTQFAPSEEIDGQLEIADIDGNLVDTFTGEIAEREVG
jgi:hypothetical protein